MVLSKPDGPPAPQSMSETPGPGRPGADAPPKSRAILDAARDTFLALGYEKTSMDLVASRAGVSKATIYSHFGSKEALFGTLVTELCEDMVQPLSRDETDPAAPEAVLRAFGHKLTHLILASSAIALYRVVIAETPRFPELGETFYRCGPLRSAETLAAYLDGAVAQQRLRIENTDMAARQFIGMVISHLHVRELLHIEPRPSRAHVDALVEQAVVVFLRAYGPG